MTDQPRQRRSQTRHRAKPRATLAFAGVFGSGEHAVASQKVVTCGVALAAAWCLALSAPAAMAQDNPDGAPAAPTSQPSSDYEYYVVRSTDPAVARGETLQPGAEITLMEGGELTLLGLAGETFVVRGAGEAVVIAGPPVDEDAPLVDTERMTVALAGLVTAPSERRSLGGTRGEGDGDNAVCVDIEALTTLVSIVEAYEAGCRGTAREAFKAYYTTGSAEADLVGELGEADC